MKKLFFAAMAVAALTITSCGNKTAAPAADTDSIADSSMVDTTALAPETKSALNAVTTQLADAIKNKDAKGLTAVLTGLAANYKEMINAGKLQDALTYGKVVKEYIAKNVDTIKSFTGNNATINNLLTGIQNLPTDASTTAESAAAALKGLSGNAVESAKDAAANAKDAAANAKDAAAAKANEAVDATKAKASEAVNEAAAKTNKAVNDAASKAVKGLGL